MKTKLGIYELNRQYVSVYTDDASNGASFTTADVKCMRPSIIIGIKCSWVDIVENVIHEALEMALAEMRLRYHHTDKSRMDYGHLLFVFNHNDLIDICSSIAPFISSVLADLSRKCAKK